MILWWRKRKQTGFPPPPVPPSHPSVRRWDGDAIIASLRRHKKATGHWPAVSEWEGHRRPDWAPSPSTVKRAFGSWKEAVREAEL